MRWAFLRIPLLLAVLMVVVIAILTTGTGLRLVARIALPMVPGQVSFESLQGRVIGPVTLTGLQWENDDQVLSIDRIELEWRAAKLLSRHVYIQQLDADGVRWRSPEPATETAAEKPGDGLPDLPVSITAEHLQIDDIVIEQGTTDIRLHTLQLSGSLDSDRYRLDKLLVRSDEFDVEGTATISRSAMLYEIDTAITWTARLKDIENPIQGTATATGNTDALELSVAADGPFELTLTGTAKSLLDEPLIDGKIDLQNLDPALAGLDPKTGALSALLNYSVSREEFAVDGRILAPGLLPMAAVIGANAKLTGETLELRQLNMQLENLATTIRASGTLLTDLSDLNLRLDWTDLSWPLGEQPDFVSPGGGASLTGSKDRFRLELNGTTNEGVLPAAKIALRGNGTSSEFEIAELAAVFEKGRITAQGILDWAGIPKARLQVASQNLDLSQWQQQLEGRLGFDSVVVASIPPEGAQASVEIRKISGQLQDKTLTGSGAFDYSPGLIRLHKIDIRAGQAQIEANGRIGAEMDLSWNISVPDIALLLPGSTGSVRSKGAARGNPGSPGLTGDLVVRDLKVGTLAAAQVDGDFDIGVSANAMAQFNIRAADVAIGSFSVATIDSNSRGTVAQHRIELDIDSTTGKLNGSFQGGIANNAWQGEITKLTASRSDIGQWQVANPSRLTVQRDRVELQQLCLSQDDANLCVGGTLATTGPWRSDYKLTDLPLQLLASISPTDLEYEGIIAGEGYVEAADGGWAGTASVQLSDGRIRTRENSDDNVLIDYESGTLAATFDSNTVKTRLNLDLRDAGIIDADITIPLDTRQQLTGTVQARVENLSIVTALVPQVGRIDGRLEANLNLAGMTAAPDLSGQIGLRTTELVLPDLGITLQNTIVNVTTQGNDLVFDGSAESGEGRVALTGELRWRQGLPSGQLKIDGEAFRTVDLPEIRLDTSPALILSVDGRDISVTGSVTVPAAQITPVDIASGITISPDQVIIGDTTAPAEQSRWRVNANVEVTAGDAVHLKGYGLEGNLQGSVVIVESPDQPTIGRGALEIKDGRYRAYGQELKIETGRLTFTGGQIDDPGLNLLATRTAGDVIAGAQVRGALRAPILSLYSVPAMSDAQTMSYLITGRGLQDLNEFDQAAVSETATRLALQGGSVLASSLGRGLGLDSVEFTDSGATASTELVVGKHLSPRLFVSYGIGLFEAINTVRLRYRINSRLTLETQSGTRTSADLLYSLER